MHTATDLGPRVAEVLSSEMTHGMTQVGVPHFTHATINSVCNGVDAVTHTNLNSRSVHCYCCMMAAYIEREDWIDHLEDETLFGCLFEVGEYSNELGGAHAGMVSAVDALYDKSGRLCEIESRNSPNFDTFQADHRCETICRSSLNICQLNSEFGQSTSSCGETGVCLDITHKNIRLRHEEDTILNHLIQWKRDNTKSKRKAMNRNWSNQKANPALNTKAGNK